MKNGSLVKASRSNLDFSENQDGNSETPSEVESPMEKCLPGESIKITIDVDGAIEDTDAESREEKNNDSDEQVVHVGLF